MAVRSFTNPALLHHHPARFSFARMLRWSQLFAGFSLLLCIGVFVAYSVGVPELIRPRDDQAIHPVAALAALLLSLATLLAERRERPAILLHRALTGSVIVAMLVRLIAGDLVAPWFDLLVPSAMAPTLDPFPAVSANSATCMLLLAIALLCRRVRDALVSQTLAFLAYGLPTLSLIGYLLGIGGFHGRMSLTTVLILIPLCAAVMLTTVRHGFLRRLLGPTRISALAREYLLLIMMLPYLLGLVLVQFGPASAGLPMAMLIVASSQLVGLCVCFLVLSGANIERSNRAAVRLAESRSHHDSLTGALSRARFTHRAGQLIEQRREHEDALSVLFIDIDHFKQINDTYGHATGDRVLKRMIALTRDCLRRDDIVARWGGEEFVVLLPGTDVEGARKLAENIRTRICQATIRDGKHDLQVTISIGCAQVHGDELLDTLIARADEALYRAKHQGRNRTVVA